MEEINLKNLLQNELYFVEFSYLGFFKFGGSHEIQFSGNEPTKRQTHFDDK